MPYHMYLESGSELRGIHVRSQRKFILDQISRGLKSDHSEISGELISDLQVDHIRSLEKPYRMI
jgi:hypothetical protein